MYKPTATRRHHVLSLLLLPVLATAACVPETETPVVPTPPPAPAAGPETPPVPMIADLVAAAAPDRQRTWVADPTVAAIVATEVEGEATTVDPSGDGRIPSVRLAGADPQPDGLTGEPVAARAADNFAPENAGGLAITKRADGRPMVFASDKNWSLLSYREKVSTVANADWTPWQPFDTQFFGGRRMAITSLRDGRQQVWVVDAAGTLRTSWETAVEGEWVVWGTQRVPTKVKDVVATGGNTTHLFILGVDDVVRVAHKTGGANSGWSSWASLGKVPNARGLSAITFESVHQVFVASAAGAYTAWGNGRTFNRVMSDGNTAGVRSLAAGQLADGRIFVIASDDDTKLRLRGRNPDGTWTAWMDVPLANPGRTMGFDVLAVGKLTDGRVQFFGIGTDGKVYTVWEQTSGGLGSKWSRFFE